MEIVSWLKMNIEFEETLLSKIKKQFGVFHQKYKVKLQQINDLKEQKNKQLKII